MSASNVAASSSSASSSSRQPRTAPIPAASHHLPPPLHGLTFLRHLRSALSHDTFLAQVAQAETTTLKVVRIYAVEYLRRDEESRFALERACMASRVVSHPHLLTVERPFASRVDFFLVEDFCSGGDMFEYMTALAEAAAQVEAKSSPSPPSSTSPAAIAAAEARVGTGLAVELARRLTHELLSGVHYLHTTCGLVHRNIKLETLFLDASMRLRLGGFGLCAVLPVNNGGSINDGDEGGREGAEREKVLMRLCCGSRHYAAPELMQGQPYDGEAVDAWACGVVLFAFLTGCFPFDSPQLDDDDDTAMFRQVCGDAEGHLAQHPALSAIEDPQAVDLIRNLLRSNPQARFTVGEALEHPFLA